MRAANMLVLASALAGCAHSARFHPALPEQAVAGQPEVATAEVAGVRVTARAGDWQGWPDDLEEHLTPVEAIVENGGGKALRVRAELFGLLGPSGFRYQALEPADVHRQMAGYWRPRASVQFYYGFYGVYPWPGFGYWRHRGYPFAWWGWYPPPYGFGPPPYAWAPPPPPAVPAAAPEGNLEPGGRVALLLLFPVPAVSLPRAEVTLDLVDVAGERLGVVRLPLLREGASPRAAPPAATPPALPAAGGSGTS